MIPGQSTTLGTAAASPNGKARRVSASTACARWPAVGRLRDCRSRKHRNDPRASLVVCLTCGWVACSDDSPNQHARAHYEETDHPVAAGFAPGSAWRWCYVHQRLV